MPLETDLRDPDAYVTLTLTADDLPAGAAAGQGSLADRAMAIADLLTKVSGARRSQPIEFGVDSGARLQPGRATTVHLRQQYHGVPVFDGQQTVRFSPQGEVRRTQARLVAVDDSPDPVIGLAVERAAGVAIAHLEIGSLDLSGFEPEVALDFPDLVSRPTVLRQGPFAEPITARLVWIPVAKRLRLAWDLTVAVSEQEGAFRVTVAADDGAVLYCAQVVAGAFRGHVYLRDPGEPRQLVDFPRPWQELTPAVPDALPLKQPDALPPEPPAVPGELPAAPPGWVEGASTSGYAAVAATPAPVDADADGVFDDPEPLGVRQQVINAFYGTCFMHDLLYLLGFREADGNYQEGATDALGRACRRVKVEVRAEPVYLTAHWWPLGPVPAIRLGPKAGRHTALDMTILFHEYTHGLSSRLVGGAGAPHPLRDPQSKGMAEGWGDYVACTITGSPLIGGWLMGDGKGLRRFPYDEAFPVAEANFGILDKLGTYEIGELWCATLLDLNRRIGATLALRLVLEGMRDLMQNPGLLDGRDGILTAVDDLLDGDEHRAARTAVWAAFAGFGMGAGASSIGADLTGAVADHTVPG
jgi:extracellular elastinolytic metalloproteinase